MQMLFLNNIPVRVTKDPQILATRGQYDYFVPDTTAQFVWPQHANSILIMANKERFDQILTAIGQLASTQGKSVTVYVEDIKSIQGLLQQKFKIVQAAGGIVRKEKQILMIYRLGKWDLPKGKVEKREKRTQAAIREIEEECGIMAKPVAKLCSTWHSYTKGKIKVLKKTTWYVMTCIDDTYMRPQREEGIDQVKWVPEEELNQFLHSSYVANQYVGQVFRQYATSLSKLSLL